MRWTTLPAIPRITCWREADGGVWVIGEQEEGLCVSDRGRDNVTRARRRYIFWQQEVNEASVFGASGESMTLLIFSALIGGNKHVNLGAHLSLVFFPGDLVL